MPSDALGFKPDIRQLRLQTRGILGGALHAALVDCRGARVLGARGFVARCLQQPFCVSACSIEPLRQIFLGAQQSIERVFRRLFMCHWR
jgi:hypothetical protein